MKIISLAMILASFFLVSCTNKKLDLDQKALNVIISSKIKGFDPIFANDLYSSVEISKVYEGLFEFHYLKRPYTLEPNLAESMPVVSDDGLTYTFKIKKGVFFQDNSCFPESKGRELEAKDFVYSLQRIADPKLQSTGWWVYDGKIAGLNEWRESQKGKEVNYELPVTGLKALDKHTLQIKLSKPFPQFLYGLAMPFSFVVARECVEKYGAEFLNNPVGTGPYQTGKFENTNKIVYTKNPTFRKKYFPSEGYEKYEGRGFEKYKGKTVPLVDRVVTHIMIEDSTRWLNFKKGKVDFLAVPKDNFDTAITPTKELTPEFKKKQISLTISPSLDVTYIAFNHHYALFRDNVNLRRAMSMAYDGDRANKLFYNSNAMVAQSVVPPGIAGYLDNYKNPYKEHNIEKAKALLAKAGYPEGKGLQEIPYDTSNSPTNRQMAEFFAKQMANIGIKIKIQTHPFPELQKRIANKKSMIYGIAWGADYPDAENFLQLLYGPNKSPGANGSNYDNNEFNEIFEKAVKMQDGPVRTALYEKLNRMAAELVPWIYGVHRKSFVLNHAWLKNFVATDFEMGREQYLDIDLETKQKIYKKL